MWIPKQSLVERIHDYMIARMGGESGPLNPNNLHASIERSKTVVFGHEPFKDAIAKASALGYGIISWHPFLDGNKRTAVLTMYTMLRANGIGMALPPFIVKYAVQVALPPDSGHHIEEPEFIRRISALCYTTNGGKLSKEFRYSTYPRVLLRLYLELFERFPKRAFLGGHFAMRLFDWYAANDYDTMIRTLQEWQMRSAEGYPKEIPPLEINPEDFEDISSPDGDSESDEG